MNISFKRLKPFKKLPLSVLFFLHLKLIRMFFGGKLVKFVKCVCLKILDSLANLKRTQFGLA